LRLDERLRWLCSFAPSFGLVAAPDDRPNGISAIVRVKGEEEWLEPCLLSIRDFADEVVLLDNGAAPATRRTIEAARAVFGTRLRVEECPELDLFEMSNLGLARARFRWTIRWDADFVAHTSSGSIAGAITSSTCPPPRWRATFAISSRTGGCASMVKSTWRARPRATSVSSVRRAPKCCPFPIEF
jgi:hypothetical protein